MLLFWFVVGCNGVVVITVENDVCVRERMPVRYEVRVAMQVYLVTIWVGVVVGGFDSGCELEWV